MQELLSLLNEDTVYEFLLLFARLVAFVAFMPVFGHTSVSPTIRIALAFYMTIFLFPFITFTTTFTQSEFLLALIAEVTLGLVAAFSISVMFSAVRIIGDFIGYATVLSMANIFDPATGTNEGLVSKLLFIIALVLFFQTSMYEMTIVMLVHSFSSIHLGTFNVFSYDGILLIINEIKRMFAFAFAFALPLFFIGFIMDLYYGYGTKSMPSFSPFVITFQLKFALIFLFLILGIEIFTQSFTDYFISKFS